MFTIDKYPLTHQKKYLKDVFLPQIIQNKDKKVRLVIVKILIINAGYVFMSQEKI
jgi:hypothetical protein